MKIGIYNRHWNTFGGGEKYAGALAACLSEFADVDLICHEDFSIVEIGKRLDLSLTRCNRVIIATDSIAETEKISAHYDLWINASFISLAGSRAKKSIRLVFFPYLYFPLRQLWNLFPVWQPAWAVGLLRNKYGFLKSYDVILSISLYTQKWIKCWWHVDSTLLTPPVDMIECSDIRKKKNLILGVGRFVADGHNKKQHIMVKAFKEMCDAGSCPGGELHLCGGTHPEALHQDYVAGIRDSSRGYPIFIHTDISRQELEDFYRTAGIFWHATGFGESDTRNPERFEHFGITTVEAMSAGCVPIVINKAGQKEIVEHGVTGFLWNSLEELKQYTVDVINNPDTDDLRTKASDSARQFSSQKFRDNVLSILKANGII